MGLQVYISRGNNDYHDYPGRGALELTYLNRAAPSPLSYFRAFHQPALPECNCVHLYEDVR